VHWVREGRDAPPSSDRNRNGVPDYVEKVREVADRALTYYALPKALPNQAGEIVRGDETKRLKGFRLPPCDTAGPNALPDIYVASSGPPGRSFAPALTRNGPFVVISNRLQYQRPGQPAVYGSLQATVAHEVFHLVQYAYVPEGLAGWLAESSANWNAYDAIKDDSTALINLATKSDWWLEPWKTVADPADRSTRAYGANWLWWNDDNELVMLLDLLSGAREAVGAKTFREYQLVSDAFARAYYIALGASWKTLINTGWYVLVPGSSSDIAFHDSYLRFGRFQWHVKCEAFAPINPEQPIRLPDGTKKPFRLGIESFMAATSDPSQPLHPRNDVVLKLEPLSCPVIALLREPGERVRVEWEPVGGLTQDDRDVVVSFLSAKGEAVPVSMNGVGGQNISLWGPGSALLEPTDPAQFMFVTGGSLSRGVPSGIRIRMSRLGG
jgi:hypothetical protein